MRSTLGGMVVVLAALAAMAASPATAFHGAAYTARGTATLLATGETYDAVLRWSGAFGIGGGTYTIELYDQDTGAQFHKNSFPGKETLANVHFVGCVEVVDYTGVASIAVQGINYPSFLPNPIFKITGWQNNNLCTGIATMHYEGHYLSVFQLVLDVWGPPGA